MFGNAQPRDRSAWVGFARAVIDYTSSREANRMAAAVLTLVVVLWRLAIVLRDAPKSGFTSAPDMLAFMLTMVIFFPALLAMLLLLYLFFGGIGWLIAQLTQLAVQWRAEGQLREGMPKLQIVLVVAGVIFLGVPELMHAITWWHEHALRFVPGEEAALDTMVQYYDAHADTFQGMILFAAIAFWPFRGVAKHFRLHLRESVEVVRHFFVHRDWRLPSVLAILIAVTVILLVQYEKGSFKPEYDALL